MSMENNEIRKKIDSINWNFDFTINYQANELHPFNCRKYFSYPATFIPEIPYSLIEILSRKGDVVLDPFGGIGTTFMQALLLEREPYSFDINPVASSVCNTLFSLFDPKLDIDSLEKCLENLVDGYDPEIDYASSVVRVPLNDLDVWFESSTYNKLNFLLQQCNGICEKKYKEIALFVLSSILVRSSSQNKGWAYIADNVKPKESEYKQKQVFDIYKSSFKVLLADIRNYRNKMSYDKFSEFYLSVSESAHIVTGSFINSSLKPNSVDLVVTSPPYPKMIDYVKSQRLSFEFFDKEFKNYVSEEIGARARRAQRDCLQKYIEDIRKINKKMVSVMKKGAFLCIVLPDYDYTDARYDVIKDIVEEYKIKDFEMVYDKRRYIPSNKRTLSIQWATLVNERIYIYRKN